MMSSWRGLVPPGSETMGTWLLVVVLAFGAGPEETVNRLVSEEGCDAYRELAREFTRIETPGAALAAKVATRLAACVALREPDSGGGSAGLLDGDQGKTEELQHALNTLAELNRRMKYRDAPLMTDAELRAFETSVGAATTFQRWLTYQWFFRRPAALQAFYALPPEQKRQKALVPPALRDVWSWHNYSHLGAP